MYEQSLIQAGLSYTQAMVYEALLKNGAMPAGKLTKKTPFKRGLVYLALEDLMKLELVEKDDSDKKAAIFQVKHPLELQNLAEKLKRKASDAKLAVDGIIQSVISDFNLISGRPGVRFFEGAEGVKKVLEHISGNFEQNTEIVSFVKVLPEKFENSLKKAFDFFIKKRNSHKVSTRVISIDTPEGIALKKGDSKSLRETRLVSEKIFPLDFIGGEIFIYKNEICSVMLEKENYFAFIVQSAGIAQMLRAFFESHWILLSLERTISSSSDLISPEVKSSSKTA